MKRETKIGIFAVAVLTSTFFVVNYLRGADVFGKDIRIISHYSNVEGLVPSNPVYMKGYKSGSVSSVEYNPETYMFDVVCAVKKKMRIPADTKMTIYSVDIMGGKGIRLDLGTSDVLVRDGAELMACTEPDMISSLTGMIGPLVANVSATLDTLKVTGSELNRILSGIDDSSMSSTLAHADKTMANLEKLTSGLAARSPEIDSLLVNFKNVSTKLVTISGSADLAMDGLSRVVSELTEADLKGLVESLRNVADGLADPEGTVGRMLSDGEIYDALQSLIKDIDSLVKNIEADPKKYLKIKASIF